MSVKVSLSGIVVACMCLLPNSANSGEDVVVLIKDRAPQYSIVLGGQSTPVEAYAAGELQGFLHRMSLCDLPLLKEPQDVPGPAIYIGNTARLASAGLSEKAARIKHDGFLIEYTGDDIFIAGREEDGTLFGVYEFLEWLGVRWYMPGRLGEVLPRSKTVEAPRRSVVSEPDYPLRWIGENGWSRHNKMNVNVYVDKKSARRGVSPGKKVFGDFHTHDYFLNRLEYAKEHPEYYTLSGGRRGGSKLCLSSPEAAHQITANMRRLIDLEPEWDIITLAPTDGAGSCFCPKCERLDEPDQPMVRFRSLGERKANSRQMTIFNNRVAKGVQVTHPDKLIKAGAYNLYRRAPRQRDLRLVPNLTMQYTFAGIEYSYVRPVTGPESGGMNTDLHTMLKEWAEKANHLFIYQYYWKMAWLDMPWPLMKAIKFDIPYLRRLGFDGFYTQYTEENSFSILPNYYLTAKLLWDSGADMDGLLRDFYERFYGEAAEPMQAYYSMFQQAMEETKLTVSGQGYMAPWIYTPAVMEEAEKALTGAERKSRDPLVRARLELARAQFIHTQNILRYCGYFRDLLEKEPEKTALTTEEFEEAAQLARIISTHMTAYAGRQLWLIAANNYFRRLLRPEFALKLMRMTMESLELIPAVE